MVLKFTMLQRTVVWLHPSEVSHTVEKVKTGRFLISTVFIVRGFNVLVFIVFAFNDLTDLTLTT